MNDKSNSNSPLYSLFFLQNFDVLMELLLAIMVVVANAMKDPVGQLVTRP